jgi:prepilin-type N-terminal cleavage/methylation domain-containing protein
LSQERSWRGAGFELRDGFSLIELLVAVAVLLVIMGAVLTIMVRYQRIYGSEQLRDEQRDVLRGAAELMTQEIGQAGCLVFASSQVVNPITNPGSQAAVVQSSASTPYIFAGEKLLVDAGPSNELVTVTSTNASQFTADFTKLHAAGAPVNALGAFPTGVLSTANGATLELYGDVNSDETLQYVEYNCSTAARMLTRSETPVTASSQNAPEVLIGNLVANPGGTPCFRFETQTSAVTGATIYVTNVNVTLTAQTSGPDPTTGAYRTVTYSFNVAPRNVLAALSLAQIKDTDRLQPTPPGLPMP